MSRDEAKCPHCGSWSRGKDLETLEVKSGRIGAMGTSKSSDVLYVCPDCETILG